MRTGEESKRVRCVITGIRLERAKDSVQESRRNVAEGLTIPGEEKETDSLMRGMDMDH